MFTFLAIFTMAVRISIESDTWWHLRAGAEIIEQRALLTEDPFSLTRNQEPWRYPGWLAQITIYGLYDLMGFAGLNIFTAFMVTLAFIWVWRFIEGPLLLRTSLILLAAITSGIYWSARPQIISFMLSGAFIYLLERERTEVSAPVWSYLVIMGLWGNIHGGFAIGFLLLAAYAGGEVLELVTAAFSSGTNPKQMVREGFPKLKRYLLLVAVCLVGLALNPHGPSMILYPFKTVSIGVLRQYIQEWQSPDFHSLDVLPFMFLILVAFLAFGFRKKRGHPTDYLLVLGFMGMSFWAARNIAIFALASLIPISRAFASSDIQVPWQTESKPLPPGVQKILNLILAGLFLFAAGIKIAIPLDNTHNQAMVETNYPSEAIEVLRSSVSPAPIFNSYNWGAYLIWELYPAYLSFVDGRTDLFDDEILEQYLAAWRADPEWTDVFHRWKIKIVFVESSAPIAKELNNAGWPIVFMDDQAVIFIKPETD